MLLRRRVKTFRVGGTEDVEAVEQVVELEWEGEKSISLIALREFVLACSDGGNVRVYDRETSGVVRAIFAEHTEWVVCLARLEDDLIVSADCHGQMFTWRPSNTDIVGSWSLDETWSYDEEGFSEGVARLDDERLVVSIGDGNLAVLSHSSGADLKLDKRLMRAHKYPISTIVVSDNTVVSCSYHGATKLWNKHSFNHFASLRSKHPVGDVAVSDTQIIIVCSDGRIYVHRNTPPYTLDFILRTPYDFLGSIICVNNDIAAIAGYSGCVSFVSLSNKSFIARIQVSDPDSIQGYLSVLSDNRIALANDAPGCIMFRPPNFKATHPILDAWNSVQQQSLSLIDACNMVIKSENTSRSLDEWCVAHDLLMHAVKTGVVSRSRDHKGTVRHWHLQLYQHCDELAIGERDIGFLISLFDEAERAGVIAEGTSENLITAVRIRKDIDKDKRYSTNAIYRLFLRQAETDARLQQVLHYQKVQQFTSITNALLGFVPIGGAMATNAVAGTAAILNELQVSGLVQSLLSVGKDLSGGFGTNTQVDLFLRRSNEVLSEDHWYELGEENRQAVQDAARNLGLTVEELRSRLLYAAEMIDGRQPSNQEENETELVAETEYESNTEYEASTTEIANKPAPVGSNIESNELDFDVEGVRAELTRWANKSMNKASIENLKFKESASCLAAFLVNYDEFHVANYARLRKALQDVFSRQFIDGSLFVYADRGEREELFQTTMSAIAAVVEGPASRNLGIRLKRFLQQVLES